MISPAFYFEVTIYYNVPLSYFELLLFDSLLCSQKSKTDKEDLKKNPFRRVNKMRGINCIIELFKELQSSELWA